MITYSELLQDVNWQIKRNEILNIDNFKCQYCHNTKLISAYNISSVSIGIINKLNRKSLIFIVYDPELKSFYRIRANKIITYEKFMENWN